MDEQHFRSMHESYIYWSEKAAALKHAADVLKARYDTANELYAIEAKRHGTNVVVDMEDYDMALDVIAMLLLTAATENLLKGIVITADFAAARPARDTQHHKLCKLAVAAGISLTQRDAEVLADATELVEWRAKYPTPRKDQWATATYCRPTITWDELLTMWSRANAALEAEVEAMRNASEG